MFTTLKVFLCSAEFPTPRLCCFIRLNTRQRATETWDSRTAQPASVQSLSVSRVSSCVLGRRATHHHVGEEAQLAAACEFRVPAKCGGRFVNANLQDRGCAGSGERIRTLALLGEQRARVSYHPQGAPGDGASLFLKLGEVLKKSFPIFSVCIFRFLRHQTPVKNWVDACPGVCVLGGHSLTQHPA